MSAPLQFRTVREQDRRRVPREQRRTHDIKQLWEQNHEVLNLLSLGMKGTEVAERLNITPATVSNIRNSTLGQEKLSRIRELRDAQCVDVLVEIQKMMGPALAVYQDILESEECSLKLKKEVADTVLMDIGGHAAPKKLDVRSAHVQLTQDDLEEIKQRARAAKGGTNIDDSP